MFDKKRFAQILKNISETYNNQRDFSNKSGINRTYLSQYMNMKLDDAPKPITLEKLAKASKNLTSYDELMVICGYIDGFNRDYVLDLYNEINKLEEEYHSDIDKLKLSFKESEIAHSLFPQVLDKLYNSKYNTTNFHPNEIVQDIDFVSEKSKNKIAEHIHLTYNFFYSKRMIERKIKNLKYTDDSSNNKFNKQDNNKLFIIPVLGKIAAGEPVLAEQYIEGYLPVDPNIYGMSIPEEYFYLKVNGESMNLKIHNGDYALIHKQDYAEDGNIVVAIVNGDEEATLKRYKRINEEIVMLEPMSTLPMEPIVINLKETPFKIIGKAIGQFGKF